MTLDKRHFNQEKGWTSKRERKIRFSCSHLIGFSCPAANITIVINSLTYCNYIVAVFFASSLSLSLSLAGLRLIEIVSDYYWSKYRCQHKWTTNFDVKNKNRNSPVICFDTIEHTHAVIWIDILASNDAIALLSMLKFYAFSTTILPDYFPSMQWKIRTGKTRHSLNENHTKIKYGNSESNSKSIFSVGNSTGGNGNKMIYERWEI